MWPTEDLGKICPALPHNVIPDLALNRVNRKRTYNRNFILIFCLLTLLCASSGITLLGQTGQILPKSSVGQLNSLNDLLVLGTYFQVNILDFISPQIPKLITFDDFFCP